MFSPLRPRCSPTALPQQRHTRFDPDSAPFLPRGETPLPRRIQRLDAFTSGLFGRVLTRLLVVSRKLDGGTTACFSRSEKRVPRGLHSLNQVSNAITRPKPINGPAHRALSRSTPRTITLFRRIQERVRVALPVAESSDLQGTPSCGTQEHGKFSDRSPRLQPPTSLPCNTSQSLADDPVRKEYCSQQAWSYGSNADEANHPEWRNRILNNHRPSPPMTSPRTATEPAVVTNATRSGTTSTPPGKTRT